MEDKNCVACAMATDLGDVSSHCARAAERGQ
jgi:hypothetical protein